MFLTVVRLLQQSFGDLLHETGDTSGGAGGGWVAKGIDGDDPGAGTR